MPFISSGRFRTNAQKKRLDVWLIYRCATCEETWNMPILERRPVAGIPPEQLHAFIRNDPAAALRHAFDLARLARHGDQLDHDTALHVQKRVDDGGNPGAAHLEIVLVLSLPCRPRLDALLAQELGMSRGALRKLYEAGGLALAPASRKALRTPLRDGQRIRLDLSQARRWGLEPDRIWQPAS